MALGEDTGGATTEERIDVDKDRDKDIDVEMKEEVENFPPEVGKQEENTNGANAMCSTDGVAHILMPSSVVLEAIPSTPESVSDVGFCHQEPFSSKDDVRVASSTIDTQGDSADASTANSTITNSMVTSRACRNTGASEICEVTPAVPGPSSYLASQKIDTSSASAFVQSIADIENRKAGTSAENGTAVEADFTISGDSSPSNDTEAFLLSLGLNLILLNKPSDHVTLPEASGERRTRDADSPSHLPSVATSTLGKAADEPVNSEPFFEHTVVSSSNTVAANLQPSFRVSQPDTATLVTEASNHQPNTAEQINRKQRDRLALGEKLESLLDLFDVRKLYPGKLTSEKVREYTLCPPSKEKAAPFAVLRFFYKLMHNHVGALSELLGDSFNSVDVLITLLLVADDHLRKDMFSKMAMLQYALPVCVKIFNQEGPLVLNWSLRSIVKRWSVGEKSKLIEEDMHSAEFVYASFIRAGDLSFSKAKILNKLFPRENAPFQSKEEDDIPRELSDGCIELSWLFPIQDEVWEPVAVTNLRGNAAEHVDLVRFLSGNCRHIFVFIGNDMADCEFVLAALEPVKSSVVLILPKTMKSHSPAFEDSLKSRYTFIQENEARLSVRIKEVILSNNTAGKVSFSSWEKSGKDLEFDLEDERELIRRGKRMAEAALKTNSSSMHNLKLPLQGGNWTEYSMLHKEQLRVKQKPQKTSVSDYCEEIRRQKESLRLAQSKIALPQHFVVFAQGLCTKPAERKSFIYWLGYFLDKMSRGGTGLDAPGFEHFMREIAQMYEVDQATGGTTGRSSLVRILENCCGGVDPRLQLRNTVVDMLLEGHPFELLDGNSQGIPEVWLKDVMTSLACRLDKSKRIGVVSVLGVQSSGKSTLLNAMFGCNFGVSSGRCTRGVNMQLIKVGKQFLHICETDYILILDSEGLKSPETQDLAGSTEHDSELGTLVVGLSDVVMINVASESMDALKDIIQITIHAFIRMKQTNRQKTKCFFVHQNTCDPSAYEKLTNERILFEKTLQELTDIAARMEFAYANSKLDFREVLDYGRENSHEYFPGLYSGTAPMAPINSGYAAKVMSVKNTVLMSLKDGMKLSPEQFSQRVIDIWQAVLKEDFIFSYKNSLIASKRSDLDDKIADWESESRTETKEFFEGLQTEILNESEVPPLTKYSRKVQVLHEEQLLKLTSAVEEYLKQDPVACQYFLEEARSSVSTFVVRAEDEMTQRLKNFLNIEESKRKVDRVQVELEQRIQKKIAGLVEDFKREGKELTPEEADQEFETLWAEELGELDNTQLQYIRDLDFDTEIQFLLLDYLPKSDKKSVKELLSKKKLSDYYGNDIYVEEDDFCQPYLYKAASATISFVTGQQPESQSFHYEAVRAFVHQLLKNFDSLISAEVKDPKLTIDDFPDSIRRIFKKLEDAVHGHVKLSHKRRLVLKKNMKMKIFVQVAASWVFILKVFRDSYLEQKDPILRLEKQKNHFRQLFLDLSASRSLSFTAAGKFIEECLMPGIAESVRISMDRVLAAQFKAENEDLRNRKSCEIALYKHLKKQGDFFLYLEVIHQYKATITNWLRQRMDDYYHRGCSCELCIPLNRSIFEHLLYERMESSLWFVQNLFERIIEQEDEDGRPSFRDVLKSVSAHTVRKLVLRVEVMEPFADSTDGLEFAENVLKMMDNLSRWSETAFGRIYADLAEGAIGFLIESLIGCGNSCPFCGAPCALNSSQHAEHTAEFHRPQVIVGYSYEGSEDAMAETCPAYILRGGRSFKNQDTNFSFVAYDNYRSIYPSWNIPPDMTLESGMFWKWVLVNRVKEFSFWYGFNEESLPAAWRAITWEMVSQEFTQLLQGPEEEEDGPQT